VIRRRASCASGEKVANKASGSLRIIVYQLAQALRSGDGLAVDLGPDIDRHSVLRLPGLPQRIEAFERKAWRVHDLMACSAGWVGAMLLQSQPRCWLSIWSRAVHSRE